MNCGKPVEKVFFTPALIEKYKKYIIVNLLSLGINIKQKEINKFIEYLEVLKYYQEKINVTAITDPFSIIKKHFLDSLAGINYIKNYSTEKIKKKLKIIDVGSGAGFPGIPINILFPDNKTVLLEARKNKIIFLKKVINDLRLENIETIQDRAENIGKKAESRETYDIVLSRAVASLNILSEYCLPLCAVNGIFIVYKGSSYQEELDPNLKIMELLGAKLESINILKIPDSQKIRSIIIFRKINPTPDRYPRRNGIPQKRPLCF